MTFKGSTEKLVAEAVDNSANPRRNRVDIAADILKTCASWTRKTRIMYGCNLSYSQTESYLELLNKKHLLLPTVDADNRKVYRVTEKGERFLTLYREMAEMLQG